MVIFGDFVKKVKNGDFWQMKENDEDNRSIKNDRNMVKCQK